jgi:hypothetical protein
VRKRKEIEMAEFKQYHIQVYRNADNEITIRQDLYGGNMVIMLTPDQADAVCDAIEAVSKRITSDMENDE